MGTGKTAEKVVIGMVLEELLDLGSISIKLLLEGVQEGAKTYRQTALGLENGIRSFKLIGFGEDFQSS